HTSLKATDWLTVFGSLRYDYYQNESEHTTLDDFSTKSDTRLNPAFGITIEPLDGLQIFSSYTSGWRPPSLRETAVNQAGGVSPNPNLRPETSSNI
ncbi:TonB-dependent receptor, partial [Staphylococcus aureus]|nr:TonB-dependent receptor [Staphylococcus aureus]